MKRWLMIVCMIGIGISLALVAMNAEAGSSKKEQQAQQTQSDVKQEVGQPPYFDPKTSQGAGTDDSAPYSDPWYGKEETYKGGHGSHPGPKGKVDDPGEVKVIEGPVRYERVQE